MRITLLSLILVLSQTVTARQLSSCDVTLSKCDAALQAEQKVTQDQDALLASYEKKSQLQQQIISDREAQLSSPLRDPVKVAAVTTIAIVILEIVTGHIK